MVGSADTSCDVNCFSCVFIAATSFRISSSEHLENKLESFYVRCAAVQSLQTNVVVNVCKQMMPPHGGY